MKRRASGTTRKTSGWSLLIAVPFFGVFAAAGSGMFYFLFLSPYLEAKDTQSWVPLRCEVLRSEVRESRGDEGGYTYAPHIEYQYEYEGRRHQSAVFKPGSNVYSSGRDAKQAIVDAHPIGSVHPCWVNPADPSRAVLDREPHGLIWGLLLFSLPFLGVGYGGLVSTLYSALGKGRGRRAEQLPSRPARPYLPASRPESEKRLVEENPPGRSLWFTLGITAFWNSIVAVFVFFLAQMDGGEAVCVGLFLLPFVVIGLGMFYATLRAVAVVLGPQPQVDAPRDVVRPGEELELEIRVDGRLRLASRLRVALEGREEATYTAGTTTTTDRAVFHHEEFFSGSAPRAGGSMRLRVRVPADAMHSFEADRNAVRWSLTVTTDVWPAEPRRLQLIVAPTGMEAAS